MDQLVLAIPQEVDARRQLLENKDSLLQQAQNDAKRRRTEAENVYRNGWMRTRSWPRPKRGPGSSRRGRAEGC